MTRFAGNTYMPSVNIATWFLTVVASLGVLTRLGTKYWISGRFSRDDTTIVGAIIAVAAQTVAMSKATENGYGEHFGALSRDQRRAMMKSQYAASLFYIIALVLSKLSFAMFIRAITPVSTDRRITLALCIAICAWGVACFFTAVFQCAPPSTWDYMNGKCYNIQAWQNFFGISSIVTEVAVLVQMFLQIARIQAGLQRKINIMMVLGLRIFAVIATIVWLVFVNLTANNPDPSYGTWAATVINQVTLCVSIITACSPQFKPFLDSLQNSGMRIDGMGTRYYRSYGSKDASANLRSLTGNGTRSKDADELPIRPANETTIKATHEPPDWDADSQTSQSRIIRETRTWTLTAEHRRQSFDSGL
ncbi:hypothetical protein ETB97_001413 [Aspergillus alliaceus]|uniref:Rhodopsin domain-containing protein n=1 Tax=Petromyces alliaceus TaxID=209559 RepID=A0A8H6A0P3_PETAA|nr:hypothetical protein ETB97_001413 [Aspergillus burnettii]